MLYTYSEESQRLQEKLAAFFDEHIYPNEEAYHEHLANAENRWAKIPLIDELKEKAKAAGLWNMFILPSHAKYAPGDGLSNLDYMPLCEMMGRVHFSSEVFNCSAPDTGNMEVLMMYGSPEQQERWLTPLLNGEIRSSFAMTEPAVASSDATNIQLRIEQQGNEWVLNGRKWFITGAMNERTEIFIVMGKSDPDNASRHKQQSMVLVPKDTPGVNIIRPLTTFGYDDAPSGHAEIVFEDVRVPLDNILLGEGRGFEIAQGRLGPGRMHHCMRLIGGAQRVLELACKRVGDRSTFGKRLDQHQSIREDIAKSYAEIEMMRLLVAKTCAHMDKVGAKNARDLIAAAKIQAPQMTQDVVDRCMQMFGAGGFTEDFPISSIYTYARWCRQADGPDQVHMMSLGKEIISRYGGEI